MTAKPEGLVDRVVENVERLIDLTRSWVYCMVYVRTCADTLSSAGIRPEHRRVQMTSLPQKYRKLAESGVPVYELPVQLNQAMVRDFVTRRRMHVPYMLADALTVNAVRRDHPIATRWYAVGDKATLNLASAVVLFAHCACHGEVKSRFDMRVRVNKSNSRMRRLSIVRQLRGTWNFEFD